MRAYVCEDLAVIVVRMSMTPAPVARVSTAPLATTHLRAHFVASVLRVTVVFDVNRLPASAYPTRVSTTAHVDRPSLPSATCVCVLAVTAAWPVSCAILASTSPVVMVQNASSFRLSIAMCRFAVSVRLGSRVVYVRSTRPPPCRQSKELAVRWYRANQVRRAGQPRHGAVHQAVSAATLSASVHRE